MIKMIIGMKPDWFLLGRINTDYAFYQVFLQCLAKQAMFAFGVFKVFQ